MSPLEDANGIFMPAAGQDRYRMSCVASIDMST